MYKVRSALSVHGTPVPPRDDCLSPGRILTWFPHSLAAQHGQFDVIHVRVQPLVSITANYIPTLNVLQNTIKQTISKISWAFFDALKTTKDI